MSVAIRQELHVSGPRGWINEVLNDRAAPTKLEVPKGFAKGSMPYIRAVHSCLRKKD